MPSASFRTNLLIPLVLMSFAPNAVHGDRPEVPCPGFTVARGDQCALESDVDLAAIGSVEIGSGTHLNCRGHRIHTSLPGTSISDRSQPEVGIFLREVEGVTIQNCVLEGFDFPILAINSKHGSPNSLLHNTVVGRYSGITLVAVDNTRIKDSDISYTTPGGLGIAVLRDSDNNEIKNNVIAATLNDDVSGVVRLPGPASISNPPNAGGNGGIYISQGTGLPNLLNAIVDGRLYQFPTVANPQNNASFPEDTLIEGNTISASQAFNDISLSATLRPVLRSNSLGAARMAILFGAASYDVLQQFPGSCSLDPTRLCLGSSDCFIPEVDDVSKGSCTLPVPMRVFWISRDPIVEDNTLTGPFNLGIQIAVPGGIVRRNQISGPVWPGTDFRTLGGVGIDIRRFALESATFTGNTIMGFPGSLRMVNFGRYVGAKVFLNDFVDAPYPVFADRLVTPPSELSVGTCSEDPGIACSRVSGGLDDPSTPIDESLEECAALGAGTCVNRRGNYWGLTCAESDGFADERVLLLTTGFVDAGGALTIVGTPVDGVRDSHPYGAPVAEPDVATCLP
jgi:hypothetical protein